MPVLNVTLPVTLHQIGSILKKVERYLRELPAPPQLTNESTPTCEAGSSSSIPEILHHARSVLPSLKIQDPFMWSVEITERVYNITNNIVSIFELRTKQSVERRIITIAAGFLAWNSCHYHDKKYNSEVPFTKLREPKEKCDFQTFLTLTKLDIDDLTARHATIGQPPPLWFPGVLSIGQNPKKYQKVERCCGKVGKKRLVTTLWLSTMVTQKG